MSHYPKQIRNPQSQIRNHFTGSSPPLQKGWQRKIRFTPSQVPFNTPYFATASIVYVEQVGSKRQEGGKKGERNVL